MSSMTKEELIEAFSYDGKSKPLLTIEYIQRVLNEFFKDKVIIQRGDTLQANVTEGWIDVITLSNNIEYRIKPSEPVYEWQWLENGIVQSLGFYTENEVMQGLVKIESTKRERKC